MIGRVIWRTRGTRRGRTIADEWQGGGTAAAGCMNPGASRLALLSSPEPTDQDAGQRN